MGHRIKYVREASEDLDRIHDYIVQNFYSETIAKSTISKIISGIRILGSNPYTGVNLDRKIGRKIHPKYDVRMLILDQYLTFYTVINEQVNILRILNAKQDYMKFLNDFSALEQD